MPARAKFRRAAVDARLLDVRRALAAELRKRREARGLTQAALGKRLGVSGAAISSLERVAGGQVTVDSLLRLIFALDDLNADRG